MSTRLVVWVGLILAAAIFGLATQAWPVVSQASLLLAGALILVGAATFIAGRRGNRKYDLDELRRVHERAEIDTLLEEVPAGEGNLLCLGCGEVYPPNLPTCPRCRCARPS